LKKEELGITDSLGIGFVALGEAVQEGKDLLWDDLFDGSITDSHIVLFIIFA
jgi:hypothetical protein